MISLVADGTRFRDPQSNIRQDESLNGRSLSNPTPQSSENSLEKERGKSVRSRKDKGYQEHRA